MSAGTTAAAAFPQREAVAAVVTAYASALDTHDWTGYRALFADQIALDYGAIGSLTATISADDWVERCRALEGFDATAHRLHNLTIKIDGDTAVATSIVDAAHFVTDGDFTFMGDLIGRYTHHLQRHDRWKIAGVTLGVVGYPAGKAAFDTAFALARSRFAERESR